MSESPMHTTQLDGTAKSFRARKAYSRFGCGGDGCAVKCRPTFHAVSSATQIKTSRRILFTGLGYLFLLAFAICSFTAQAATITAVDGSWVAASNAVALATHGDTVQIPAGTNYWTSTLVISNKAITFQGAGYYDGTSTGFSNQNSGDTMIVDEAVGSYTPIIKIIMTDTNHGPFRMTGFHLKGGTTNTGDRYTGSVQVSGTHYVSNNAAWRIDHCYDQNLRGVAFMFYSWGGGVFDHNFVVRTGGECPMRVDGTAGDYGDLSWASDVAYGTVDEGVIMENNYCKNTSSLLGMVDAYQGARYVFRYNTVTNGYVSGHGTESSNRERGVRWVSVYENDFASSTYGSPPVYSRSGTGIVASNRMTGSWSGIISMQNYRLQDEFSPWGGAWGANVWDLNYTNQYDFGTNTGGALTRAVTDSSKSWTPNQWVNYAVINLRSGKGGTINTNSATTLYVLDSQYAAPLTFTTNDTYEIRRVQQVLDGNGVGKGDLLTGVSTPSPVGWPNQVIEPWYYWGNTGPNSTTIQANAAAINGRNYTNVARVDYTALVYPHPLISGGDTNALAGASISPTSATHVLGQAADTFTASITTGVPEFYQWSINGADVSGANSVNYSPVFDVAGTYEVNFWASNSFGPNLTNSVAATNIITTVTVTSPHRLRMRKGP